MIKLYGIEIEQNSSFWDEVKLRAMNNYGEWDAQNIGLAIEDVFTDLEKAVMDSPDTLQLEKEITEGQA